MPARSQSFRPWILATILFSSCSPEPRVDAAKETQAIRELDEKVVRMVAAKDSAGIAELYAEHAAFLPPNEPRVTGRDAIRSAWGGFLRVPNLTLTLEPKIIEVSRAGDLAYDIGSYWLAIDGPTGRTGDEGKYLVVWKKMGGEWKMAADMYSSDRPLAPPSSTTE